MLSKEYTFWHLTPDGWFSGSSKTDFNSWSKDAPANTVLTIEYREEMKSAAPIEKSITRFNETKDKDLLRELEAKFPFEPFIMVYD